jgi:DNA repair photolyase
VERIIEIASEAGAVSIGGIGLHLRGEVRDVFMDWLRSYRPDLVDHYEQLYARGAYLPNPEKQRIAGLVRARSRFTREHVEDSERRAMRWRERAMRRAESEPSPEAPVEQPTLF